MRINISGAYREDVIKRVENALGVESVNIDYPGMEENEYKFFHHAAESFKYFNKKDVIFDGGVFDNIKIHTDLGMNELKEQVILSVIDNMDKFVIITKGMSEKDIEFCKSFADLYPTKFDILEDENEFEI